MLLGVLFFGIFCFCVCEFFYYLIRSGGADMYIHARISSVIENVDSYDELCYSIKSAIVSKAKEIMQHLYGLQSSANTNTSATNIPVTNTPVAYFDLLQLTI
jgi:hypothetical protein